MTITLTPEQQRRLEAAVAAGQFASVEEAVRWAVDHILVTDEDLGDLSWAKPYLDEAREAIARGESISLEEVFAEDGCLAQEARCLMAEVRLSPQARRRSPFRLSSTWRMSPDRGLRAEYDDEFKRITDNLAATPGIGAPRPHLEPRRGSPS